MFFAFLFILLIGSGVLANENCSPGSTWENNNIRFECLDEDGYTGFMPIGCVSDSGLMLNDGDEAKTEKFHYQCHKGDKHIYSYDVIGCLSPSGAEIDISQEIKEDGYYYACMRESNSDKVKLLWGKDLVCQMDAKNYFPNVMVDKGDVVYKCVYKNGMLTMDAWGCVLPSGGQLHASPQSIVNMDGLGLVRCIIHDGPPISATLEPIAMSCIDQESIKRNLTTTWIYDKMSYRCELKETNGPNSTWKPKVIPRACYSDLTYNGSTKKNIMININKVKKVSTLGFFWCRPTEGNNSRPFETERISDDNAKCSNGKLLFDKWIEENIRKKCTWNHGEAKIIELGCASDDETFKVSKNKIQEKAPGEAYKCEKIPDSKPQLYRFRRLTEEEYNAWKYQNMDSAFGTMGTGVKYIDENGNVMCDNGFVLVDDKCKGIGTSGKNAFPIWVISDVDECLENMDTCDHPEHCRNFGGGFKCVCKLGFARDVDNDKCHELQCHC